MNLYESIKINKIDKNKVIKNKAIPANNQYNVEAENDNEKKLELIVSIIKAKNDLQIANDNFEFAEGDLIDYFLYEIKANQSKLDYLLSF